MTFTRSDFEVTAAPPAPTCPPCFEDPADYTGYAALGNVKGMRRACLDCTLAYQSEMTLAGRCQAPEVEYTPLGRRGILRRRQARAGDTK